MEESRYQALFDYLSRQEYPPDYSKTQKYVLRRASKSYTVKGNHLFYTGCSRKNVRPRHVLKGTEEVERVFLECHLSAGGHRGRDCTIGKIKERYYWPNFYKNIEERVSLLAIANSLKFLASLLVK